MNLAYFFIPLPRNQKLEIMIKVSEHPFKKKPNE